MHIFKADTILPPCFIFETWAIKCPSCGATRTLNALFEFRWQDLLSYNLLFIPLILLLNIIVLYPKIMDNKYFLSILLSSILIFTILRNLF